MFLYVFYSWCRDKTQIIIKFIHILKGFSQRYVHFFSKEYQFKTAGSICLSAEYALEHLIGGFELLALVEFKGLLIERPHIITFVYQLKILIQILHLIILLIIQKWNDRYSILNLRPIWERGIINKNNILEVSIAQNPKIFHVSAVWGLQAFISEECKVKQVPIWI